MFPSSGGHNLKVSSSIHGDTVSTSNKYFVAEHAQKVTFFNNPGADMIQEAEAPTGGAPMELYASVIKGDKAELKKIITGLLGLHILEVT